MNDAVTMRQAFGVSLGRIDQYELKRELGGGGFGTVYLAKDTVSGVDVAVKGLPPFVKNNREEMDNIRANFNLVHDIHHPHIVAALYLHPAKDVAYASSDVSQKLRVFAGDTLLVMAYAPGITLSQWRKQFPGNMVPVDKALEIVRQVAEALDYAHGRKVVHRDIKPANVMIETDAAGRVTARVLDFGLAAEIRSSMGRVSKEVHDTSGTRPYMAPEQWLGGKQGPATDQYALAVLFHELVAGEVPFASVFQTGDPLVMMNVVGREPPELPEELSRSVKSALAKALGKKMGERFGSCAEFVLALEGKLKIARGGVKPRNARAISPAATVVAASVLAVAGVGVWHWRGGKAGDGAQTAVPALVSPRETVEPEAADPGREVPEDAHAHSRKPEDVDESVRRAQLEAENAAKEKARQDAEREKARLEAEAKAREQAERIAEATRQAKAREEAEKAKRVAEAAAREEAERAKRIAEAARKKELYRSLAVMEVKIADYEKFRYRDAISRKLDVLKASLKAAQSARDANDIPTASAIVGELARPCDELETLIGEVEAYYAAKDRVEAARNVALSAKADSYAKAPYGQAEANYRRAGEMAAAGDYPGAAAALARLPGQYEAAREEAANSAEAFYDRAQAALKGRDLGVARECFQAAADKKHPLSLINLGLFYLKGTGVAKDEKRALDLFREAALAGNARAQYLLGGCYAKAVGTGYDRELSRIWMAIAEVGGSRAAAEFLRKAQWPVSAGERRAIGEMLRGGETSEPISADMKAVLKSIHDNCAR